MCTAWRGFALRRRTSLSGLVQRLIIVHTKQESDSKRRKRLQAEVLATIGEFSAADRLKRDEIHKRPPGRPG